LIAAVSDVLSLALQPLRESAIAVLDGIEQIRTRTME
jgi:hypothetical protein